MASFRKTSLQEFHHQIKDIRTQLFDQIKCLEQRTEVQVAILGEVNDFLKKKAELDLEYSKHLDKLVKSVMLKHKNEKQKRANWTLFSACQLWQQLVDDAKEEARQRSITADVYANHVAPAIAQRSSALQKISKKCREIGVLAQGEVVRVLHELQTAMKTYQLCFSQFNALSSQLQHAEALRNKVGSNSSIRKQRSVQKTYDKKSEKYEASRLKCTRARNEYLLCIDAANASLHKFFADDISDLVDCCDLGMDWWLSLVMQNMIVARKSACQVEMNALANLGSFKESLQSLADKQRFFENNHQAFMLPKRFDFKCEEAESVGHISVAEGTLAEEFRQRHHQIRKRLSTLKAESELSWQNMEETERQIRDLLSACTLVQVTEFGIATNEDRRPSAEGLESELIKAYESYMQTFSYYLFNANLIMRLEARADGIGNALTEAANNSPSTQPAGSISSATGNIESIKNGKESTASSSAAGGGPQQQNDKIEASEPPDSIEWAQRRRKKRIGSQASTELAQPPPSTAANPLWRRPRLFGGSLEEYTELTGEPIPLVVVSCIGILSQYALHHQGIFRISGSQLEINHMREAFELGEDPLRSVQDASDANSIAGVLKLYLRELREPLFPFYLFDLLTDCAKCSSTADFINKLCPLLNKLPRPTYLLLRYLFAFLNHLSEFSDENMMDPYNLAICFGPTLLPIPEGKDQVYYQNSVNEVVKNLIVHADVIFTARAPGPRYEKYALDADGNGTPAGDISTELDLFVDDEVLLNTVVEQQQQQPENWSALQHKRLSSADLPFPPPSPQFHRFQQHFQQQSPQQQHQHKVAPFLTNHQQNQQANNDPGSSLAMGSPSSATNNNHPPASMTMMDWSLCSANSSLMGGGGDHQPSSSIVGGSVLCPPPPTTTTGIPYHQQQRQQMFPTNNNTYCYSSSESGIGDSNSANTQYSHYQKQQQQQLAKAAAAAVNGLRNSVIGGWQQQVQDRGSGSHLVGSQSPQPQQQHNPAADLYASIHKGERIRLPIASGRPPQPTAAVQRAQSNNEGGSAPHHHQKSPPAVARLGTAAGGGPGPGISPPPYSALYGPSGGRSPPSTAAERNAMISSKGPSPTRRRNSIASSSTDGGVNASPSITSTSVTVQSQHRPQPAAISAKTKMDKPTSRVSPANQPVDQLRQQRLEQINAIDELLGKLSTAGGDDGGAAESERK